MATILVIEDDEQLRMLFQGTLTGAGHRVLLAEKGNDGLRLSEHQEIDLVMVHMFLPDIDGDLKVSHSLLIPCSYECEDFVGSVESLSGWAFP
jgi:DNA-binding response OmpR family regulator